VTDAPDVTPLAFTDVGGAVSALREHGLRVTASRRLVLEALFSAEAPLSAEQVARHANLDLASVYRNLETFERLGLARHVHLGHGPGLYALSCRGEREYLFCDRCGEVRALAPAELDPVRAAVGRAAGYEVAFTHFALVGRCARCSEER
jgi:Fur family ferric uptake transcriptional regulator